MKKIMTIFSIIAGVFFGGCKSFEVIELTNPKIERFFESYSIEAPAVEEYRFGNVLLIPYFTQNPSSGYYDLRLSAWSSSEGEEVRVESVSISPLEIASDIEVRVSAESRDSDSELFMGHEVLVRKISGVRLYEFGSDGGTVDVRVTASRSGETKSFAYSFTAKKKKVAAPMH